MLTLQAAAHVRHTSGTQGDVLILDIREGLWITLNPTAGRLWRSWQAGATFEEAVAEISARHPAVSPESIRADAERLVQALYSKGLITALHSHGLIAGIPQSALIGAGTEMAEPEAASLGPRPTLHRAGGALIALLVADVLIRCSFRLAFALVRASRRSWCRQPATPLQGARNVAAVNWAARCYPGRAACLEQSLAAVLLAAAKRRQLDWCIGSASNPYRFHAWTEVGGQPIPRSQSGYSRILAT